MTQDGYVMVYRYRFWDPDRNEHVVSKWEATPEAIKSGLGEVLPATGRQVPRSSVDHCGRVITPELSREQER